MERGSNDERRLQRAPLLAGEGHNCTLSDSFGIQSPNTFVQRVGFAVIHLWPAFVNKFVAFYCGDRVYSLTLYGVRIGGHLVESAQTVNYGPA